MADNPRVPEKSNVDPTGLYLAEAADAGLIGAKSIQNLSDVQFVSVPVPDIFLRGGLVPYNMSEKQRISYGAVLLGVNGADLFLNDLILDNRRLPDQPDSNVDIDPNDNLKNGVIGFSDGGIVLPDRITPTTIELFADEIDGVTDPIRDMTGVMRMIRNTPDNKAIQFGNSLYYSAHLMLSAAEMNQSIQTIAGAKIDSTDPRVDAFIDQMGGYPRGVDHDEYDQEVADLIEMYQSGGNTLSHQDLFRYAREVWGMDLSGENKPMETLILGALDGTAQVTPSSGLAAMLLSFETMAASMRFELGVASATGLQYTVRNMTDLKPLEEDVLAASIALATGAGQIGLAAQLNDGYVDPLTVGAVAAEQGLGFTSAKIAQDDPALLTSMILTSAQMSGAITEPRILAGLTYANDLNYKAKETKPGKFEYTPNPTVSGLINGMMFMNSAKNLAAGKSAGHYVRIYTQENDLRYLAPVLTLGAAHALEVGAYSHYMSHSSLPKAFQNQYETMLHDYNIPVDELHGNSSSMMPVSAGISAASSVAGITWGYFAQTLVEKKKQRVSLLESSPEVLAAQSYYDDLQTNGADAKTLDTARTQVLIANTNEQNNPLQSATEQYDSALNKLQTLTSTKASPILIELANRELEFAREKKMAELDTSNFTTELVENLNLTSGPALQGLGAGIGISGVLPIGRGNRRK